MSTELVEPRNQASLLFHYIIERDLAWQLRRAWAQERLGLYRTVYDELFRRIPDHPQHTRTAHPAAQEESTRDQLSFVRHFLTPETVYLEIGCGDAHLAMAVAPQVRQVYAVDVSELIARHVDRPENFRLLISDGINIDIPSGTATFAYSNQLIEHLHPEDAERQLQQVFRALAPGGAYACITPHRFSGPHDISRFFADEASGFHLKEYTHRELRRLFLASGFASTAIWVGVKGAFFRMPATPVLMMESVMARLPRNVIRQLTKTRLFRPMFGNMIVVGHKE